MKNHKFFLTIVAMFIALNSLLGQTCISDYTQIDNPYYAVDFERNSYITISSAQAANGMQDYLNEDFTLEFWVYPQWSKDDEKWHFMFSYGEWDDDHNSLFVVFESADHDGDHWAIRVSDGNDEGSNSDLLYKFTKTHYENNYKNKWNHICVTFDSPSNSDNDGTVRLYVNGSLKATKTGFDLQSYTDSNKSMQKYCYLGEGGNHNESFYGYMSGFRLWNQVLSDNSRSYVRKKTFHSEGSFHNDYDHLFDNLIVDMRRNYTSSDNYNIWSTTSSSLGIGMNEHNIPEHYYLYHPGYAPKVYNLTSVRNCDNITLNWDKDNYGTAYVYRKRTSDPAESNYRRLCRTNSNFYIDETAVAGEVYEYFVDNGWYNDKDPFDYNSGVYDSENEYITASLKKYTVPTNFKVLKDASSGDCQGQVMLDWKETTPAADSYYIKYNVDNGGWATLVEGLTETNYTHIVPTESLGKEIKYKVDGAGDGCTNYSEEITGFGNKICSTPPTDVVSAEVDGNILVTWVYNQSGAPATSFKVYRKTSASSYDQIDNVSADTTEYFDYKASMCTEYTYKIEAYNSCGSNSSHAESNSTTIAFKFDNVFTYEEDSEEKAYFDASKGYYNNKVTLEWDVNSNKLGDIETYEIYRRESGQAYNPLTTIFNANTTYYEDKSAEANQLYEYLIRATGDCNGDEKISDTLTCVGFRTNTGIISGKITYEGGNAVENVEVRVSTEDANTSSSLYFNGVDNFINCDKFANDSLFHNPLSVEAWIKPDLMVAQERNIFFSLSGGIYYVGLKNMKPIMGINTHTMGCGDDEEPVVVLEGDTVLNPDTWYHIATNFDPDPDSGFVELYLNGKLLIREYKNLQIPWAVEDKVGTNCGPSYDVVAATLGIGKLTNTLFAGNIDEVRVWQRVRTPEEIERDYVRLLIGDEDNLIGYYRLDENFGNSAYDLSKDIDEFNKNDYWMDVDDFPEWSSNTPSFEQLHPSGISDKNGNYIVKGIRYSGNGNIFSVSPVLGVHEFNPTDINLYVGDNEPVHNNVNFIDESAFQFSGTVYYKNTNFPVSGASIFIDNQQVFNAGGQAVLTGDDGKIDISVPIGEHYISVKKSNHVFVDNGQWPVPTDADQYKTFNFQDDVYDITFYDSTTVKLCGRFVGDNVEGDKVIGFNKSINNIGVGDIIFENEQKFDIDFNSEVSDTNRVSVSTNKNSGEYEIIMLPEVYKIHSVKNSTYNIQNNNLGILDLSQIPELTTLHDTSYTDADTTITTFEYHFQRNFIVYSEPEITVYGKDEKDFIGEEEIIIQNPETEENDTINLVENSPFNYPVFVMPKTYDIDIRVEALYYNYDDNDTVIDIVPIKDAEVSITNNLEIGQPSNSFTTNEEGKVAGYTEFRVGLPNMNKDESNGTSYTKSMTITAETGAFNIEWNEGDLFRAYTLGCVDAGGANFVTFGVDVPSFILRDPPGSNSYTYLEKESTYSISRSYNYSKGSNSLYDNTLMMGVKFEVGGGLTGPVFTSETQSDINAGIETTSYIDRNGEFRETYRFTKRYSTSDADNAVGSMADVYIGKSANMFFTETNNLRILPKSFCVDNDMEHLDTVELSNPEYTLGIRPGFAVTDDSSATTFIYSQDHILNTLLPNYRDIIYVLLASNKYDSKVSASHLLYGTSNDAPIWRDSTTWVADSLHASYEFLGDSTEIDSVAFINQQISMWLQTIAWNEAAKVDPDKKLRLEENISYDGNSGPYTNELSYTSVEKEQKEYFHRFAFFGGSESGFNINGFGLMTYSQAYKNYDIGLTEENEETASMTWGYVLDDDNAGDFYSIDVKMDKSGIMEDGVSDFLNSTNYDERGKNLDNISKGTGLGAVGIAGLGMGLSKLVNPLAGQALGMAYTVATSAAYLGVMSHYKSEIKAETTSFGLCGASPVFTVRGGQSRCPYEGPEYTLLYADSNDEPYLLHVGTQNHEAPKIDIEPATVINVPEGDAATFELKLKNESATGKDLTYELWVNEKSNPHGAELKIDGISPNRPFFITAGQTLTKTLTVERGASGEMDFENLQIILHSSCQYNLDDNFPDIADTVSFSVNFIPVCTEVEFGNITEDWVVNCSNNDTLPVNITGYNINQETFEKIIFQYQQSGATPTTAMTFYKDTSGQEEPKMLIEGHEVDFDFSTAALNDGQYTLILKTICTDGSQYEADQLVGTIDRITPRPFGTPQPADGILSVDEEISIQFNEEINAGDLYAHADYISVKGIVNGTDLINNKNILHDASVHFDGINDYLVVQNGINLDHSSFTIEFWVKREQIGRECLLSLGAPSLGGLWIGFDQNDRFMFQAGGQTLLSDEIYNTTDQWAHYACVYNIGDENTESGLTMIISFDANTEEKYLETDIFSSFEHALYAGFCPEDMSAFKGNMHELRIWNYYKTIDEISAQKSQILNGYEEGLYGLWPMNDVHGNIAHDIAFGRNGEVHATWQVSRDGKAVAFDGDDYLKIPTGSMVFDSQDNFTVEFWFKTPTPTKETCMLSNGKGDGTLNKHSWSIVANGSNNIVIRNNGISLSIEAGNYLDNDWHHFSMTMNRLGYLTIMLDGKVVETETNRLFSGFGASKLVVGAKWYGLSMTDHYESFFTGTIDELRIWNSCRTHDQIERFMNYSLKGDEYGLKAYFPFEDVTIADPSISNETLDNMSQATIANAGDGSLVNAIFTNETPNIKLQRPEVGIPFSYVINDDKVIITPSIEEAKIENSILDFAVVKVKDMNNNQMSSTVTWSAFIDKNQLVWDMQELSVDKLIDEEVELTVNVLNNGGIVENFEISNLPSWMDVNPVYGTLNPQEGMEVTITIKPELNIGNYNRDINLVSSMGFNERLNIKVKVKGEEPGWDVDPDNFEYSANLIGQLKINGVISTDTDDYVGAFINGECRGVSYIEYLETGNMYILFMDIYDNEISGNDISFKVYDASTGEVYAEVSPLITFQANHLFGSVSDPLIIDANVGIEQELNLNNGWSWISFNVYNENFSDLNTVFNNMQATPGDIIKANDTYAQYTSNGTWAGTLIGLNYQEMYKVKAENAQTLTISGVKVIPDTVDIAIVPGWNWIGYPSHNQVSVKEAMSTLTPVNNDILKSQNKFAVYDESLGWIGSLDYLQPGKGYMLSSVTGGTLIFSGRNKSRESAKDNSKAIVQTSSNMTMIVELALENSSDYKLNAYNNQDLCGIAEPISLNGRTLYFITLNSENSGEISFKAVSELEENKALETINYSDDAHLGTIDLPIALTFGTTGVDDTFSGKYIEVYPNPFSRELSVNIGLKANEKISIELYDLLGRKVYESNFKEYTCGYHQISLSDEITGLVNGTYVLKIKSADTENVFRIIKQ